ncbi:hypothetical protein SAMN05421636_101172 [Pricia antarctica]|uniref:Viral A-type inclusion protein n=1 Tax=Pricia antarctica TaxID=641691 RepID=A0A1G6W5J7_9FLAO|nr:hypothetical protein [Pricia antarctica]SDD60296.1 hypothetical protein SAMN05421636_101172 [Pricia antarctica]
MKKLMLLMTIALITFSTSCKEKKESIQMKEVMAVHDEIMPKMGQFGKLVGQLKGMENDSTEMGMQYKKARIDLQDAHKAMMDWMQNFGNRFTLDEIMKGAELSEQKLQWLDEEEEKVKALKEQINSSIENAQNLLGKED